MEVEVKDYFLTVGGPTDVSGAKKKGLLARRLKPLGKLFTPKRSSASSKKHVTDLTKNGKADRRKSGSTSDMPTNYDSYDDPSQDHRTEPTTSVESLLGFSFASRTTSRSMRKGRSMVPALWNHEFPRARSISSIRARSTASAPKYSDKDGSTKTLAGSNLWHRIASHQTNDLHSMTNSREIIEEGIELVLGDVIEPNAETNGKWKRNESFSAVPFGENAHESILAIRDRSPQSSEARGTQGARSTPLSSQDDAIDVTKMPRPKISITTTSCAPEGGKSLQEAAERNVESTKWLDHDDIETAVDNRPLKEIVFSSNGDQFDEMDDLTLPPTGFVPTFQPLHSKTLYSRPIFNPPVELGPRSADRLHKQPTNSAQRPSSPTRPVDLLGNSRAKNDPDCEEMFASFVEERHGSFRRESLSRVSNSLSQSQSNILNDGHRKDAVAEPQHKFHQVGGPKGSVMVDTDRDSPARSLQSNDTEDDIEVIGINSQTTFGAAVTEPKDELHPLRKSPEKKSSPLLGRSPGRGSAQGDGRDSRASRLSSLFSMLDNRTSPTSSDPNTPTKTQDSPAGAVPERVWSPHEYAMQFFGRMYRRADTSPQADIPVHKADGEMANGHVQASPHFTAGAPGTPSMVKPTPLKPIQAPPSVIWKVEASASEGSAMSGNNSASRESQTYSGDSLTRDSLMEMLDLQAAAKGDARSARWLARKELALLTANRQSDLLVRHSLSDESSLSGSVSSRNRATPVLKSFQCGGLANMYTTSMEEESFASTGKDDNIITELKADLLNTVDELKREGSFVVSKLIRQISNQK